MEKRGLWIALILLIAGGFSAVQAQQQTPQTAKDLQTRITVDKGYKGPPFFTFKGQYYGFLTDNKDRRLGSRATTDQIHKSVASGGHYILGNMQVEPADKAAPYAGQWVKITALYKSNIYGTGATSEPSIDGFSAGDGTVSTRQPTIEIVSVKAATPPNDGSDAPQSGGADIILDTVGAGYGVQGQKPAAAPSK